MKRKCRHRKVMHYGWHTVDGYWYESPYLGRWQADKAVCVSCHAWLSLGSSNDEGEAVRIEIAAAEIAALADEDPVRFRTRCSSLVGQGWWVHQMDLVTADNVTHTDDALSGYLARQIATHSKEQQP